MQFCTAHDKTLHYVYIHLSDGTIGIVALKSQSDIFNFKPFQVLTFMYFFIYCSFHTFSDSLF